ncbi:GntR family transcriptional regulator [Streptomyces iconiensis]|uniref:GntR family transcriptional regulator n=1 Tax=Streptomyces iconiensis TaxID=1384038 RepID=A0ABT7A4P3_9ACTN|nr:GntR family transcriptional regulator [Streptomyces iconiensis]MDJ1136281.1 GntR family transcriptional regulator [Streptomyces iconiensis]
MNSHTPTCPPANDPQALESGRRRDLSSTVRKLSFTHGPMAMRSTAAVLNGYDRAYTYIAEWLPLARERREGAGGSPADQARWDRLMAAVVRPEGRKDTSYEGLIVLTNNGRELLHALAETESPSPPVEQIARHIRNSLKNGTYPPGALLPVGRIATRLGAPHSSVRLALADLAASGTVEMHNEGRARVPGVDRHRNLPGQIAAWLRTLIASDVLPIGKRLPSRAELSRIVVTNAQPVNEALQILAGEQVIKFGPSLRPFVPPGTRIPEEPDTSAACASQLQPAQQLDDDSDLRPSAIRESVRKAHTWWRRRLSPHPASLEHCIGHLCAARQHLTPSALATDARLSAHASGTPRAVARRALVTEAALQDPAADLRIWRTACLATAVNDLLRLTELHQL